MLFPESTRPAWLKIRHELRTLKILCIKSLSTALRIGRFATSFKLEKSQWLDRITQAENCLNNKRKCTYEVKKWLQMGSQVKVKNWIQYLCLCLAAKAYNSLLGNLLNSKVASRWQPAGCKLKATESDPLLSFEYAKIYRPRALLEQKIIQ